jgi:hypothetical protein
LLCGRANKFSSTTLMVLRWPRKPSDSARLLTVFGQAQKTFLGNGLQDDASDEVTGEPAAFASHPHIGRTWRLPAAQSSRGCAFQGHEKNGAGKIAPTFSGIVETMDQYRTDRA